MKIIENGGENNGGSEIMACVMAAAAWRKQWRQIMAWHNGNIGRRIWLNGVSKA
jgi:hypothetical protein